MEETPRQSASVTARDLFRVLRRRFPVFLFTFVVTVAATFFAASKMPTIYEAKARVQIDNPVAANAPNSVSDLLTGGAARPIDAEMEKIKSRPFLENVARRVRTPDADVELLRNRITLAPAAGGVILDVAAKGDTATAAKKLADSVADEYIAMAERDFRKRTKETNERLREARQGALKEKQEADAALNAFKRRTGLADPALFYGTKAGIANGARTGLEEAKRQLPLQLANLKTQERELTRILPEVTTGYSLNKNPVIDNYRLDITNLELERTNLLYDYAPESDEVVKVDNALRARREAIVKALKDPFSAGSRGVARNPDYAKLQSQIHDTYLGILTTRNAIARGKTNLTEIERQQPALADQQLEFETLLAKRQTATAAYEQIRTGLSKMDNTRILSAPYISIMESAEMPKKPISPKPWLNAIMAFALGLMLASAMALLAEYWASGSISEEEMPELPRLGGVPLLGVLPIALPAPAQRQTSGLPAPLNSLTGAEDALREIGFTLARRHAGDPVPVVLFAGARTDDLSAALTAQLAATLVRDGVRVTLIDADRQNPRLNQVFGAPDAPGLADLLTSDRRATDILHIGANGALRFLAAGSPSNAAEATEANLRSVFKQLSNPRDTDIVLVSGPSVWQVGIIGPLERAASGMTIIAPGETRGLAPDEIVTRARRLLSNGYRPRILGVVIGLESPADAAAPYRAILTDGAKEE